MTETNLFIRFCTSPIVVFLACAWVCYIFFTFAQGLFAEERFPGKTRAIQIAFSIFNGLVFLAIVTFLHEYLSYAVYILIAITTLFIEFCIVFKDRFRPIAVLYSAATWILTMGYNSAIIVLGYIQSNPGIVENQTSNHTIVTLATVFTACYLYFILAGKVFELPNFKALVHNDRSKFIFLFFIVFDVISLLVMTFYHHVLFSPLIGTMQAWYFVLAVLVLKEASTLATVLFILHAQSGLERAHNEGETLQSELFREKQLRAMNSKGTFFEYAVNLTKDTFIHGQENLRTTQGMPTSYRDAIQYFMKTFVHPEDVGLLGPVGNIDAYRLKLTSTPMYSAVMRLSSDKVKEFLRPSEDVACHMASIKNEWFYVSFTGALIVDDTTGDLLLYVDVMDVDEKTRREQDLLSSASKDHLTQLLNRSAIETGIDRVITSQNKSCVMFLFDRDNFKAINDNFGHPEGDELLKETAAILNSEFRNVDLVGRLGGDEFMAFAFGLESREVMARKAESLLEKLRKHYDHESGTITTSISIGIAVFPGDGETYVDLYKRADQALYAAKRKGKDTYCFYEDIKSSAIVS